MIVQSIQCDNCGKIMKIDYDDYFELSGSIKRGIKYSLNSKDENPSHICVNCFIKHFNLMVSTTREPAGIEKQGDILKRKIEDIDPYTPLKGEPIPYDKAVRWEKPFEVICTSDAPMPQACAGKTCVTIPSINDPYPYNGNIN